MWYCNNLPTYAAVRTFLMFAARYGKQAREAATQRLRGHESVRQDEERGTWSPNQFTVEQVRAVWFASVSTVGV